jgi:hypothetical protein
MVSRGDRVALTIDERLQEVFRRLDAAAAPVGAEAALTQLADTLTAVEDQYGGVVRNPNPGLEPDGRMYPPREDHILHNADGSIEAHTRGHVVTIDADSGLRIVESTSDVVGYERTDDA